MPTIQGGLVAEGTGLDAPLLSAGVPGAGTSFVHTLTIGGTPTAGTFKLKLLGQTTAAITWSATNATLVANIDAALEALGAVGTGNVTTAVGTMTAGIGTITITGAADLGKLAVPVTTVASNNLTGTTPTLAVANTTAGVTAFGRGAPTGAKCIDTNTGVDYINTGTPSAPTWPKTGTPS